MAEYRRVPPPRASAVRGPGFGGTLLWFAGVVVIGAILALMFGHHLPTGLLRGLRDLGDGAGRALTRAFSSDNTQAPAAADPYGPQAAPAQAYDDYSAVPYYPSAAVVRAEQPAPAPAPAARAANPEMTATPPPASAVPVRAPTPRPVAAPAPAPTPAVARSAVSAPLRSQTPAASAVSPAPRNSANAASGLAVARISPPPAAAPAPERVAVARATPPSRAMVANPTRSTDAGATPLSASSMTIVQRHTDASGRTLPSTTVSAAATPPTPAPVPVSATSSSTPAVNWRTVLRVSDGDTLVLDGDEVVRLIGVDAPEKSATEKQRKDAARLNVDVSEVRRAGEAATAFLRQLIGAQTVRLTYEGAPKDRYGRTLAYLWLADGRMVNRELVRAGYASVYPNVAFQYNREFTGLEREAQRLRRGLNRTGTLYTAAAVPAASASRPATALSADRAVPLR